MVIGDFTEDLVKLRRRWCSGGNYIANTKSFKIGHTGLKSSFIHPIPGLFSIVGVILQGSLASGNV